MSKLQALKQHVTLKKTLIAGFVLAGLMAVSSAGAVNPGSIPYVGDDTPAAGEPAFNVYYNVSGGDSDIVGNEADFVRVKEDGESVSTYRNSIDTVCENGDMFDVWFYVHNGASVSGNDGGNGPSVAKDVSVRVDLDNAEESDRFDLRGFISSSNAMNINDGATIDCGDKKFKLSYVADSAQAFLDLPNELVNLPASIVGNGAAIGTNGLDGMVWGCWEQRVWIGLKVVVEEVEEPELIPPVCKSLVVTEYTDRRLRVENVTYDLNDATLNNIVIDYGDGETETVQPGDFPLESHTYDSYGEKTITATVNTTFNGEALAVTGNCKHTVKYEKEIVTACKALTASRTTALVGEEIVFNAEGMADGTDITGYAFSVNGNEVQNSADNTFTLTTDEAGEYNVTVEVLFANGDRKTNEDCAKTVTFEEEEEEPTYVCKNVIVSAVSGSDDRSYTVEVVTEQSNATVKDYLYNFGDGNELLSTNDEETHVYSDELVGEYTVTVDVRFNVGDDVVTVEADPNDPNEDCMDKVEFEEDREVCPYDKELDAEDENCKEPVKGVKKNPVLPSTGAGSIAATFAALTAAGTIGHNMVARRKQQ